MTRERRSRLLGITLLFVLLLQIPAAVMARDLRFGEIPLDSTTYKEYLKFLSQDRYTALPTSYDARDDGIVTPAKNQASCGGCWSFASVGGFESHLMKAFGVGLYDLSEQQQISCNTEMFGCCGGSMTALRFWEIRGPITEMCLPYGESTTGCPTESTVPCADGVGCTQLSYRVTNYHTVDTTDPSQVKVSVYDEGPSYFRFDVYADFPSYWNTAAPGEVYRNSDTLAGRLKLGGHAILIIGWSDQKMAYLCKNSWGSTGGPNGDGTFWIAWDGHYKDLVLQMANFSLMSSWATVYETLFEDRATLQLFREYRDKILAKSGLGEVFVHMFYQNSGEALEVLLRNPDLMARAKALIAANRKAVANIMDGDEGVLADSGQVLEFLDRLGAASSPPLKLQAKLITHHLLQKQQQNKPFFGFRVD